MLIVVVGFVVHGGVSVRCEHLTCATIGVAQMTEYLYLVVHLINGGGMCFPFVLGRGRLCILLFMSSLVDGFFCLL